MEEKDVIEIIESVQSINEEDIPDINSLEWTGFLLSKLTEDELFDGLPKVEGLRRITNEYVGEVVESITQVIQAPNLSNANHSCITHTITVLGKDNITRKCSGTADVFSGNGENEAFSWRYSSATCETRAEARAYRRLLRLRVCAAEEISRIPVEQSGLSGIITETQKAFINAMCRRFNIDVMKFINLGSKKYKNIDEVHYDTAQKMFGLLQTYQSDKSKIPENIIGWTKNESNDSY